MRKSLLLFLTSVLSVIVYASDYVVTDISWAPSFQYVDPYYSKSLDFTAIIENQGTGSTSAMSNVRFLIDGVAVGLDAIGGLESGASDTVTYTHTVTEAGSFEIEVIADVDNDIEESDETNNSLSDNFSIADIFGLPDLMITDISWFPEEFIEGESVTFQAQVENLGYGGSISDYSVRFTIDGTDIIGTPVVKDDIGLGQMDTAFSNSGFELNNWDNWSLHNNFSLAEKSSHPDSIYATHPSSISASGMLQSELFIVTDSIIGFYVKSTYYYNYVNLYDEGGSLLKQIESQYYWTGGWSYYTFNVSDYIGEKVSILAYCHGSTVMSIDNIRMGNNPSQKITVSLPSVTWTASAGEHTISAEVDVNNNIGEADETNQTHEETITIDKADYVVTDISWEPSFQYADPYYSKSLKFTAVIENQGTGSTLGMSYGSFLVDGVLVKGFPIFGLASGASTTATYYHIVSEAGNYEIEVITDIENDINESDETNNSLSDNFNIADIFGLPDIMITDISWTPEEPQEGESVTLRAQVDNVGYGGSSTDYNVRFTVDGTDIIGTPVVKDDIGLGQMDDAFSNSGFELNTWDNWNLHNNFSLAEKSSFPDSIYATHPSTVSATGTLRSETFTVTDSVIGFNTRSTSPNNYVRIYTTESSIIESRNTSNYSTGEWSYNTFNVSDYIGEEILIVAYCSGNHEMSIDNFRMGNNPSQRITVALPFVTWTASAGEHTISAEVDINNTIGEADETNQTYEETINVERADYVVTDISWAPSCQYADPYYSKSLDFTAVIENQGIGGTSNLSYIRFLIDGVPVGLDAIGGLESGASTTATFTHTVTEAGNFEIEVIADNDNDIEESDETNNSLSDNFSIADIFGLPDLMITDISWFPEEFLEGESVTLQAQVENVQYGGTRTDYSVRFTIDGTDIIGAPVVTDDIGLGLMDTAFSNSGFELNTWDDWSLHNNFSLAEKSSHPDSIYATHPSSVSATGMLQSETFTVTDSIIGFYVKSNYLNNYVNLYNEGGSLLKQLKSYNYSSGDWAYYTFNVIDYVGEKVSILAYCHGSHEMSIDNIRMGDHPHRRVIVSLPSVTWTASAGEHIIIAEVDVNNDIEESYEYNNLLIESTKSNDCQLDIYNEFVEICEGEEYKGWNEAGEYIRNFDAEDDCDSVVITHLTINMVHAITEDIEICQGNSYEGWISTGQYERTLTSHEGCDSVVTTYLTVNPVYSISEDIEICPGDSYEGWTVTGQYERTLASHTGCDSVVTTNLTVNQAFAVTEDIEICQGDSYEGWTSTGQYERTLTSQTGCDSVVTSNLTVHPVFQTVEDRSICEGEVFKTWTQSGQYIENLTSVTGCDSVVTTNLTVNPVYAITEDIEICQGDSYEGWTSTGQYERTLTSQTGCDSVVTTNLTVHPGFQIEEDITICEGEVYKTWTQSGQYIENLTSVRGCDSVVTTNLTVNPVQGITEDIEICQGDSYEGWTSTGQYERTLTSQTGCDSIITTSLSVYNIDKPTLAIRGDTIVCEGAYFSYKWYDEYGPVQDAVSSILVVEESGIYYVEVSNEFGCLIRSDGIKMTLTSIKDWKLNLPEFSVFPNPNDGNFQLEVKNKIPGTLIVLIYNDLGQILLRKEIHTIETEMIESIKLNEWTNGLYYIRLINGEYTGIKPLIIN